LKNVSREAFQKQADPATGEKWKERRDGSITRKLLVQRGTLKSSISMNAFPDGSAIIGSNLVYSRIHQEGGRTKAHDIKPRNAKALRFNGIYRRLVHHPGSEIPARPCLGVPKDFERQFFDGPAIKELLGMAGGG
jgi:phage gpG-like protein